MFSKKTIDYYYKKYLNRYNLFCQSPQNLFIFYLTDEFKILTRKDEKKYLKYILQKMKENIGKAEMLNQKQRDGVNCQYEKLAMQNELIIDIANVISYLEFRLKDD